MAGSFRRVIRKPVVNGVLISCLSMPACASGKLVELNRPEPESNLGILVMAHGGSPEWDAAVDTAVQEISERFPVEIAFGMAKRETLQDATRALEERGVARIAVVRLFISAASFLERTERLFGLASRGDSEEPRSTHRGHGSLGDSVSDLPIERDTPVAIVPVGLASQTVVAEIIAERVLRLSQNPTRESVLLLAHGMGREAANDTLMAQLDRVAARVAAAAQFREVRVETLREDWAEKRVAAEERIRGFVFRSGEHGTAIVVPVRVFGFGPYADVLQGLEYVHDGRGLLPNRRVGDWIVEQATALPESAYR